MKKNNVKRCLLLCLLMLLMCSSVGCGDADKTEELKWPDSGISTVLPAPDTKKGSIRVDLEDNFSAAICDVSEDDFKAYITKCEENGFTIDSESDAIAYNAYNEDGFKLRIVYSESNKEMSIMLEASKVNGEFAWPTMGLATLLPAPNTNKGTISIDSSTQFSAYIGETTMDDYNSYVSECIEKGFDVDYSKNEKVFSAEDAVATAQPQATEDTSNLVDGMRPEFKEAMDSYEVFFDEYCEFMKKYTESDDVTSLLADYTDYMSQYAETMEKLEAVDEDELTDAELKYYIEVSGRITQKLADVAM